MIPRKQINAKIEPTTGLCQEKCAFDVGKVNDKATRRNKPISETLMKYRERMFRRVSGSLFKTYPLKL